MIACVLVPYFSAAVERRARPALARRPLLFVEQLEEEGLVLAVSPEAAQRGVRPGTSLRQAQALCPMAEVLAADRLREREALAELSDLLWSFSPRVESGAWLQPASRRRRAEVEHPPAWAQQGAAWCYLDLGALGGTAAIALAQEIGQAVREQLHLSPALGLAGDLFSAMLAATLAGSDQALVIPPGAEAGFLAPLPLRLLKLEPELARRLQLIGIVSLGQVAALPEDAVASQLGAQGALLYRLVRGLDQRRVARRAARASEQVRRVAEGASASRPALEQQLWEMAGELATRLQRQGYAVRRLALTLLLEDGGQHRREITLAQPATRADLLARACLGMLSQARLECAVEELLLSAEELLPASGRQLSLFAHGAGQARRLRSVVQDLVARYGACFYRAVLADPAARLPERRVLLREVEA